jgi:hypothetical protein
VDAEAWSWFPVDQRLGAFPPSGDGSCLVFACIYFSPLNYYGIRNSEFRVQKDGPAIPSGEGRSEVRSSLRFVICVVNVSFGIAAVVNPARIKIRFFFPFYVEQRGPAKVGELTLLTEAEVERSYRKLFKDQEVTIEVLDKAEVLVDQLRPESPLRHRLFVELEELREMNSSRS